MTEQLICQGTNARIEAGANLWTVHDESIYDLPLTDLQSLPSRIDTSEFSLWRYRHVLPISQHSNDWRHLTLGEGATPLVDAGPTWPGLKFKVEYMMPTLSFKDRGAVVMIAKALEWGVRRLVADSSGNAGTAIAAYAARANIACELFVPSSTSTGKLAQMVRHGAHVHHIDGLREAATAAAQQFVASNRIFYASHALNPYFFEGTKTVAYEIWEQLEFSAPDHLYLPAGHGTLVLGAFKGFRELYNAKLIDRMPVFHIVQAEGCAPIAAAFLRGDNDVVAVNNVGTFAEGVAIVNPPRGFQILTAVRDTGGEVVAVPDDDIREARMELASLGFFVEPTAAISFAAYRKSQNLPTAREGICIIPLCGAGLKAPDA